MICDRNVCSLEYIENDVFGDIFPTAEEFVTNLQHEKCKVIQLVRKQIQKFNDTEYDLGTVKTDVFGHYETELKGAEQETLLTKNSSMHFTQPTAQQPPSRRKLITNIVDRVRHRVNLILAALVIGVLVWMSLVYGALLGASLCSGSRSCFPFTQFKYSYAKHSLF